jgi:3-oxoacyl-[acyl-carrier protein] reductase
MGLALVTGAAGGIGAATARRLASGRLDGRGERAEPDGGGRGAGARDRRARRGRGPVRAGAADRLIDDVLAREGRIDALVNNAAGLEQGPDGGVTQAHRDMIEVNLTAPIALMDRMRSVMGPGGAIVNISSLNAIRPPMGAAVYTATKGGLDAATAAFARELGPLGIRVNAVAPGLIEKPEAPRPAEIVEMVVKETPLGPHRHARGYRGCGGVPPVGGCGVHHRAGSGGQRGIPVVTQRTVGHLHPRDLSRACRVGRRRIARRGSGRAGRGRLPHRARGLCRGAGGGGRRRHRA